MFDDVADRLSQNIGKELPFYTAYYPNRAQISHDDLAVQALVWLHIVWFRVIRFGASYANFMTSHMSVPNLWKKPGLAFDCIW
jgi:hypothetical protein